MNWTGVRTLVTGADGFIGSHLVERLLELGAEVRAFCMYNSNGSLGWLDSMPGSGRSRLDVCLGDIRDSRYVEKACDGIDTVFHLAALIAIPYSYQAPQSFIDTNITGTLNVLESVRRNRCRRMVHTSTSEVYGTPMDVPIRETHPLQGQSPYSASKIAADKLCESFHCSFDVPVTILRPFNTYGPRQSMRALLPTVLVQLLSGENKVKLGRLDSKRDLTYVADTVEGFILAGGTDGIEGDVIQLGTGRTVSVEEIVRMAVRLVGIDAEIIQEKERFRPDASEVMILLSDPSKARERLGWMPRFDLETGLAETIAWFRERVSQFDPDLYHI